MQIKREKNSHKGSNGVVLVIGGSELYTGAPALSALAALNVGCDLAYIAAPRRAADICAKFSPDLITIPLTGTYFKKEHLAKLAQWVKKADALVIGPGLGRESETILAVLDFVKTCKKPIVIDADALKAVAGHLEVLKTCKAVLTPHDREFEILSGTKPSEANVKSFAKKHRVIVVKKGAVDIITNGSSVKLNSTGNEGMTVGGTGDVLTGVIAGLIAQKMVLYEAAELGAKVNGTAGDLCEAEKGYDYTATDVIEKLAVAMKGAK
ncbi:MAG: NAD(P)H-hydrate dehydratase [archaeon]